MTGPGVTTSDRRHFHSIDILRFAAALMVMLNHFGTYLPSTPASAPGAPDVAFSWFAPFVGPGAVGVEVFFVISGFVIAMSAEGRAGLSGARLFTLARLRRLVPALWLSALIAGAVLLWSGQSLRPVALWLANSMVLSPKGPYVDGVVWTLVVEAMFYLLVAVMILSPERLTLQRVALALGAVSTVYLVVFASAILRQDEALAALLNRFPFKVFLLRHGVFFAIGMLLWRQMRDRRRSPALPVLVVMGLVEIWIGLHGDTPRALAAMALWTGGLGWLVLSMRWSVPARLHGIARYLGGLSYTLYLNHYTLGMILTWALFRTGVEGVTACAIALGGVLLVSHLVLMAETRIRAALTARRDRRPEAPAPAR
ncbi:acyltransferase family protein [Pseudooceanicola sp. LIPI14-2-Ac024]|uniref:acyltransferase family protein n=1 Tax=Pseudooceanicola sp. LIPI14-2-Ac024 TaxID=3344875 RepID=UPI0035D091F4